MSDLRETLFYKKKNAIDIIDASEKQKSDALCKMIFLDNLLSSSAVSNSGFNFLPLSSIKVNPLPIITNSLGSIILFFTIASSKSSMLPFTFFNFVP